jgi:hypothetical protein
MSSISSQESEDLALGLKEPECAPSPSAKSTHSVEPCLESTGRTSRVTKTSENSTFIKGSQMLFAEDSHASLTQAQLGGEREALKMTVGSGLKCSALLLKEDRLGLLVKTLLNSTAWRSSKWFLIWKASTTKFNRLKFRLVPSDKITGGRASGFLATPTATANQSAPSMQ